MTQVLAEANPERYCWLKQWADEIYLAFDTVVQYSHLRAYKASFSEHFYGLKRLDSSGDRLKPEKIVASFLLLTMFPYLKRKLDNMLSNLRRDSADDRLDPQSIQYYFVKIYPMVCFLNEMSNLILQVQYSVSRSDYYSLWCKILGIRLVMRPEENEASKSIVNQGWSSWLLAKYTAQAVGSGLYAGAFFIQFLEFFYAREGSVTGKLMKSPQPPPPSASLYTRVIIFITSQNHPSFEGKPVAH